MAFKPRLAIAKTNQSEDTCIDLVRDLRKVLWKNSLVETIKPAVVVKKLPSPFLLENLSSRTKDRFGRF